MGLFDDEFYSTKVSKRTGKSIGRVRISHKRFWPKTVSTSGSSSLSMLQVAIISSVISAVVSVGLFALVVMPGDAQTAFSGTSLRTVQGDPYERIITAGDKVRPAVVSIVSHREIDGSRIEDAALGSGVIFKIEGDTAYIMTNHHVVDSGDNLEAVTVDGVSKEAKLIGKDRISDVAVLSIDSKGIHTTVEIGDSKQIRRGETVLAIGNPLGLGGTMTSGIVSYTNRMIPVSINQDGVYDWEQNVIQTDAAINEGNSGGALINMQGELIGINTMKIADMGVEGLGFAIPTEDVMKIVTDLMEDGKVSRPFLGVYTIDLSNSYAPLDEEQRKELKLPDSVEKGALVLEASGPASEAGLKLNDVIVEFDGEPIHSTMDVRKYLYDKKKIGDEMVISYYRDGKLQEATVKLADKPVE
ncbi:trypsin-like peptidase domain-containing protein [Paenibacillus sp. 453mf]|uniref:S1C family serine protease n=1 Tax=Paenibacillus sp. 453mf TaxID=1761874 RepID=UPI0008E1300F|nr:trypsin-like peptidase domain-containing protein [Paenibacillus sp. 453mf]SFS76692.1 serine protease Do [Paenibacillus sp. 453mf]